MGWGVPDWRDAESYPNPGDTTLREWWWEFTRRRPDYRKAWTDAKAGDDPECRYADDPDAFRLAYQLSVIHNPALSFSDRQLSIIRYPLTGGGPPGMIDKEMLEIRNRREGLRAAAGVYEYSFDLTQPLKGQLRKAAHLLERIQSELYPEVTDRRAHTAKWPDYLRVLDARDQGATFQEIADLLHPHPEEGPDAGWASDRYEAACRLRNNFPI